jgi:AcrR family transcriptional regulator
MPTLLTLVKRGGGLVTQAATRRERLREGTMADIKRTARELLVYGGPSAVSLRAIGRTLGMSAAALYRYFPSLEALVMELARDLYDELHGAVTVAARDAVADRGDAEADPWAVAALRLGAMARAYRAWSVGHPAEFALIFGNPVPGIAELEDDCLSPDHPGARFGAAFLEPFVALWRSGDASIRAATDLGATTAPLVAVHGDELPAGALAAFLAGWTRLYGLVAMEVFGHLRWAVTDVSPLFEAELAAFIRELAER